MCKLRTDYLRWKIALADTENEHAYALQGWRAVCSYARVHKVVGCITSQHLLPKGPSRVLWSSGVVRSFYCTPHGTRGHPLGSPRPRVVIQLASSGYALNRVLELPSSCINVPRSIHAFTGINFFFLFFFFLHFWRTRLLFSFHNRIPWFVLVGISLVQQQLNDVGDTASSWRGSSWAIWWIGTRSRLQGEGNPVIDTALLVMVSNVEGHFNESRHRS